MSSLASSLLLLVRRGGGSAKSPSSSGERDLGATEPGGEGALLVTRPFRSRRPEETDDAEELVLCCAEEAGTIVGARALRRSDMIDKVESREIHDMLEDGRDVPERYLITDILSFNQATAAMKRRRVECEGGQEGQL